MKDDPYKEIEEAGVEIDLKFLLFRQIDRCNIALVDKDIEFSKAVVGLEALLVPYFDDSYKKKNKELNKEMTDFIEGLNEDKRLHTKAKIAKIQEKEFHIARKKYHLLVQLAYNKGFYPKETITEEIS